MRDEPWLAAVYDGLLAALEIDRCDRELFVDVLPTPFRPS